MSLLALPTVVWKNVTNNCITFPDVLRFDYAVSLQTDALAEIHAGQEYDYSFTTARSLHPHSLFRLGDWIQSKKVYLRKVEITSFSGPESVVWGNFLHLAGARIRCLGITTNYAGKYLQQAASVHCTNLSELCLSGYSPGSELLHSLLQRNAQTLESLAMSTVGNCETAMVGLLNLTKLHKMELYRDEGDKLDIPALLSKCPKLTALHIGGDLEDPSSAIAIATHCAHLQRLELAQMANAQVEYLFTIVAGCKSIGYLNIFESMELSAADMCTLLQALPNLHTLAYWEWDDEMLETVAAIGVPALRNIHFAGSKISFTSFRVFAEACPKLTGFTFYNLYIDGDLATPENSVFEYCAELLYLQVELFDIELYAVLESLALYCPKLQILNIAYSEHYDSGHLTALLNALLPKCPQLRKLMLPKAERSMQLVIPDSSQDLVISFEDTIYPEWIPFVRIA